MKIYSLLIITSLFAFTPAAFAQTAPAPVTSTAPAGGNERMKDAWQRFEQEQANNKSRFEQEQVERQQRFDEMQAQRKAEFEARMKEWDKKREERRADAKNPQGKRVFASAPIAPTTPVVPTTNQ